MVTTDIQVVGILDLGRAHLVGDVPHTALDHLANAIERTGIRPAGLVLEHGRVRAISLIVLIPGVIQAGRVLIQEQRRLVHVIPPRVSVLRGIIQGIGIILLHGRIWIGSGIRCRLILIRTSGHGESHIQRHERRVKETSLFHFVYRL